MANTPAVQQFWRARVREGAVLSPVDRIAEVLFGLIMVLTFTGAISVATDGKNEIRDLLWAAVGCNFAWGLVDAIMYLMNVLFERAHAVKILTAMRDAADTATSRTLLKGELPPVLAALMDDNDLDELATRIRMYPTPTKRALLTGRDLITGVQIFLLVFLCTLPVALPFAVFSEVPVAMRTSNAVALVLLFVAGYKLAGYSGLRPLVTSLSYVAIGIALVFFTMILGG